MPQMWAIKIKIIGILGIKQRGQYLWHGTSNLQVSLCGGGGGSVGSFQRRVLQAHQTLLLTTHSLCLSCVAMDHPSSRHRTLWQNRYILVVSNKRVLCVLASLHVPYINETNPLCLLKSGKLSYGEKILPLSYSSKYVYSLVSILRSSSKFTCSIPVRLGFLVSFMHSFVL